MWKKVRVSSPYPRFTLNKIGIKLTGELQEWNLEV
jgi:hypothetical protein